MMGASCLSKQGWLHGLRHGCCHFNNAHPRGVIQLKASEHDLLPVFLAILEQQLIEQDIAVVEDGVHQGDALRVHIRRWSLKVVSPKGVNM